MIRIEFPHRKKTISYSKMEKKQEKDLLCLSINKK